MLDNNNWALQAALGKLNYNLFLYATCKSSIGRVDFVSRVWARFVFFLLDGGRRRAQRKGNRSAWEFRGAISFVLRDGGIAEREAIQIFKLVSIRRDFLYFYKTAGGAASRGPLPAWRGACFCRSICARQRKVHSGEASRPGPYKRYRKVLSTQVLVSRA